MKELSIEDKARRYDEAIEMAKSWYIDAQIGFKKSLETLFPELKESEGEEIRKWCISHFKECINVIKDNDEYKEYLSNKVIPWLEKQGESKNIDSDDLETLEIWEDAINENKEKWQLSDWFVEATSLLIQKVKHIENNENINIKGSKVMLNAAWSEEDKYNLSDIEAVIHTVKGDGLNADRLINWLKSLKNRYTRSLINENG